MVDLERIQGIAERVAGSEGLELVAVEWGGSPAQGILRIFIDRPEDGVTVADCESVSEQVGAILDVEDLIEQRYRLEVASPGLDRKLYKPTDYQRFRGRRVKVRLKHRVPELPGKRFQGELGGLENGVVSFRVDDQMIRVAYEDIATVNLIAEI